MFSDSCCAAFSEETLSNVFWPPLIPINQFQAIDRKTLLNVFWLWGPNRLQTIPSFNVGGVPTRKRVPH